MLKIKYANNPKKLQSELKEINGIQVDKNNSHEIKQKILADYTDDFEMVGRLKVTDQTRATHIRFRNITDYDAYVIALDQEYESDVAGFNAYNYKTDTPHFNLVNRS